MASGRDLAGLLGRIDGRGYKAYREIQGRFELGDVTLFVDHVQGDPFAAPSRLRLRVPQARAQLAPALMQGRARRIALADWLARRMRDAIAGARLPRSGSGKSGLVRIDAGGQEVLERTAVALSPEWVEARVHVGLPAAGRRVLGREAEALLCGALPALAEKALLAERFDAAAVRRFVECVENQERVRERLPELGLVAIVGEGSILPRESGASDRPLAAGAAVPFHSPESLRVEVALPNPASGPEGGRLVGMGVPRGVTLVVGGGYHGKSTLLRALERGVYPHVPGDGREWVVTARDLVKIRAEDGRRVAEVDIGAFIQNLPQGRSTDRFSTDDASGSTSQAACIVEAVEAGAGGLLIDEDTSATNFMVRDARMQALVRKPDEPITPFLDRVRELYDVLGVSTVLVMGGVGDYFEVADRVLMLREYRPLDVTAEARRIAGEDGRRRLAEAEEPLGPVRERIPEAASLDASRGRRDVAIDAVGTRAIRFGSTEIDLGAVEQLVDPSQTRAVGQALRLCAERFMDGAPLARVLDRLEAFLDERGLDELDPRHVPGRHPGDFARSRRFEVAAALNRLRSLRIEQAPAPR